MEKTIVRILLCGCLLLSGCRGEKKVSAGPTAYPVTIAAAVEKRVPYVVRTIGNTAPFASVDIRPQVSGELTGYFFTDGQDVEQGDLLFSIDPRPYEAALEEAVGQYEQAAASLAYNKERVKRYKELLPDDFVSILDFEQYVSQELEAAGQVTQYEGSIMSAEVNLGFCTIRSPLTGRCGRHLVDPGNIVKTDQEQPLVTIKQISPLYALFTVAEKYFPEIQKYQSSTDKGLDVEISVVGEEKKKFMGRLDFLNNTVEKNSGTILLRAIFPNEDRRLWPGQFVHVQINLYYIPDAILIPERAVRRDTQGPYVFICKEDQTVEKRKIKLGQLLDPLQVVSEGVKAGECVITDGQLSLYDGAKYIVKEKKGNS